MEVAQVSENAAAGHDLALQFVHTQPLFPGSKLLPLWLEFQLLYLSGVELQPLDRLELAVSRIVENRVMAQQNLSLGELVAARNGKKV
jgi:hypothetical protein